MQKIVSLTFLLTAGLLLTEISAKAVSFAGNGSTAWGGSVGNGTLTVTDDGTNITFTLLRGGGNLNDVLALYIDTGAAGFSTTTNFTDTGDGARKAISGYNGGSNRSVMNFTNGFTPSFAVAVEGGYASLFSLANNASFTWITGAGQGGGGSGSFTLTVTAAQLGLTAGVATNIRIFGTYIAGSAWRSPEAIAGNDYGPFGDGYNPFYQTAFSTYAFAAPPAVGYPVNFSVDMTAQVESGVFDPNVDTVYAAGTFQTNPWTGFALSPTLANTNIYEGVYVDYNPTNTTENFKFQFYHVATTSTVYEDQDNRPFVLKAPGVTNKLVYFKDVPATPSATTNYVSFSIDVGPQIYLNNFNPATDQIQVLGTHQNPKWSANTFVLTNNPNVAESNIYSGTIADGNYPGSYENYKFVIVTATATNYESGNNRFFFTPTNSGALPLAYFNNVSTYGAVAITFHVDMTLPLAIGMFAPGSGDIVSAAGTFQTNQWTPGAFALTNNPGGPNPNIYSGTYIDRNQSGAGELYKFQVISSGGSITNWETIVNRTFLLGVTDQVLPLVLWNNSSTNAVIMSPTLIKFSVDMTGATDVYGNPFDENNDLVLVDGNFASPEWNVMNHKDDIFIESTYPQYFLSRVETSLIYTNSFTVPIGHSYEVLYKYGIRHDSGNLNTNVDNEATSGMNHTRYIRSVPTYDFPVDIFGQQRTNAAAATEAAFGGLAFGAPSGGNILINWLGLPSVRLQTCTSLAAPVWLDIPDTMGLSSTNWPATGNQQFFRLVWPD